MKNERSLIFNDIDMVRLKLVFLPDFLYYFIFSAFFWFNWKRQRNEGFPGSSDGKESACNVGECIRSLGGEERSFGERNGNPLQYSCLENFMHRGAWGLKGYCLWGCKESDWVTNTHTHTHTHTHTQGNEFSPIAYRKKCNSANTMNLTQWDCIRLLT